MKPANAAHGDIVYDKDPVDSVQPGLFAGEIL